MKKPIILGITIIVICSFFLIQHETYAQQQPKTQTQAQQEQTQPTPVTVIPTVDPSSVLATTGIIGAGTAIINSVLNNRKQNKNVKGTDVDFATSVILLSKIFQVAYEIDPTWRKTLDTRATSNVLDKQTLGEAFMHEANGWASFIQEQYNIARPSMSVPSPDQINADNLQKLAEPKKDVQVPK